MLQDTMLQKLSNYEVKAWLVEFDHFTATPILHEIQFWQIQTVQICHFCNSRGSEFWFLVNLTIFHVPNLPNSKFWVSKIARNDIFGPFEFVKIGFHVKLECQQSQALTSHFEHFSSIVHYIPCLPIYLLFIRAQIIN